MNQRMMPGMTSGAALAGPAGGAPMPAGGAAQGPSGADLANGPMPGGGEQPQGGLDQALQAVIQAAEAAGFQLPQGEVSPDQLPQVYAQLLAAAAQSPMGQSPEGAAMIAQVAEALGLGGGGEQQPPPGAQPGPGMMPA